MVAARVKTQRSGDTFNLSRRGCSCRVSCESLSRNNRGDYADEKAQYGFACMLYNGPAQWASRKQRHVGTSSTHNEYMALFHACVDTVWLRKLLKEAGLEKHVQEATIAL